MAGVCLKKRLYKLKLYKICLTPPSNPIDPRLYTERMIIETLSNFLDKTPLKGTRQQDVTVYQKHSLPNS